MSSDEICNDTLTSNSVCFSLNLASFSLSLAFEHSSMCTCKIETRKRIGTRAVCKLHHQNSYATKRIGGSAQYRLGCKKYIFCKPFITLFLLISGMHVSQGYAGSGFWECILEFQVGSARSRINVHVHTRQWICCGRNNAYIMHWRRLDSYPQFLCSSVASRFSFFTHSRRVTVALSAASAVFIHSYWAFPEAVPTSTPLIGGYSYFILK